MSSSQVQPQDDRGPVEDARGRRFRAACGRAGTALIVWGVVWLVGDLFTRFAPGLADLVWPVGVSAGSFACLAIGVRRGNGGRSDLRPLAGSIAVLAFVFLLVMAAWPLDARQVHSIVGLVVGLGYTIAGLWFRGRFLILGVGLAALTLLGQYGVASWYFPFMGVVAGGALILGGLWLRKV